MAALVTSLGVPAYCSLSELCDLLIHGPAQRLICMGCGSWVCTLCRIPGQMALKRSIPSAMWSSDPKLHSLEEFLKSTSLSCQS